MSRIDWSQPMPDHWFAPHRAVAAGLAIAVVLPLAIWTWVGLERRFAAQPVTSPPCFQPEYAFTPGTEPLVAFSPNLKRRDEFYAAELAEASERCTARSCDRAAMKRYRSAVFWYMSERLSHLRSLERSHGEQGLQRARFNYDTSRDALIERGLRAHHEAGTIRLTDWRQQGDGIAMLVLGGGRSMRACRKADLAL